jgi:hypothetical protein
VTLHARKVVQALLVAAMVMLVSAPAATANHSTKDHLSIGPTGGNGAADGFFSFASANGSRAFFETPESLVAGDTDNAYDLYERQGGTTTLISTGPSGGNANLDVFPADVSADGLRVFFETEESLVPADSDGFFDVYERSGGTTTLISTGSTGGNGAFDVFFHDASIHGNRVFFETEEQLVAGDTDSQSDIYERTSGSTTLVSTGPTGGNGGFPAVFAGISQDGTRVFFETEESLVAGDGDSNFDVYRRQSGTTTLLSTGPPGGGGPHDATFRGSSLDGARVFFETDESLSASDTDTSQDVYERLASTTTLISAPGNGAFPATFVGSSGDGSRVFFESAEQLAAGDTDTFVDVYQRASGTTTLVSAGTPGNGSFDARHVGNSIDGQLVFFETREPLAAGDTDSSFDVYERAGGTTTRLSTGPGGGNAAIDASFVGASLDGLRVFIETTESLVVTDTDTVNDVYERYAGTTTHISNGTTGGNGAIAAFYAGVTESGLRVFFDTREALLATDTDTARDVYAADVASYVRPKAALTVNASLVPAFQACTSPNRQHGPPLAFGSCNPPAAASGQLTVGAPEVNGEVANSVGSAKYKVIVGSAGGPDDSDVNFSLRITDVRRQGTLADYTGQLQGTTTVRITDRVNGPSQTETGTGSDVELPVTVPCAVTASTTVGSTCSVTTTFDAVTPGSVPEGRRSIWELDRIRVNDGGADGVVATTPNTLFATQGVFVP